MCTMFMSLFSAISICNVHGLSHVKSFNINGEFLVLYIKFPNYGFSIKCDQIRTWERILDNHKQVRPKANAYLNKRECSIQECDWEEHFQEFLLQIAMCQNLVVEKFSQWKWNYRLARGFKEHIQAKHDTSVYWSPKHHLFWWKIFDSWFFLLCRVVKTLLHSF